MNAIQALTLTDLRNIRRDSLMKFLLFYPWILGLVMRYFVPYLFDAFADSFDQRAYTLLLAAFFGVIIVPPLAGFVVGFLLLDERDDGTLTAMQVTPLPMNFYMFYRIALPLLLSVASAYIVLPLMDIVAVPYGRLWPIVLLAALEGPIFALLLASLASNKVQGLAVMKGMGIFFIAPTVAWFLAEPWQWLIGLIPTYWPVKAFWVLMGQESGLSGSIRPFLGIGLVVHLIYLLPLMRHFGRVIRR